MNRLESNTSSYKLLDVSMLSYDLPSVIKKIKQERVWITRNQNALTLMKSERLRIVIIAMRKGNEMKMHLAEGPISIQIIEGKIKFTAGNESTILHKKQLLTLNENIKHGLIAIEETILLLTIANIQSNK